MMISKILIRTSVCLLFSQAGYAVEREGEEVDLPQMKLYVEEQGSVAHKEYEDLRHAGVISQIKQRSDIFPGLTKDCYTDIILKGDRKINEDLSNLSLNRDFNERILDSYPLYYREDNIPNARVGVFPWYLHDNGETYLLFSQNPYSADNLHKSESYSDLGSSMHLRHGKPETFLESAQRVLTEQTGHLYDFNRETILENSFIYFRHSMNDRQISILFTQSPYYTPRELKEALDKEGSVSSTKLNFIWVSVKSILATLSSVVKQIEELRAQSDQRFFIDSAFEWDNLRSLDGEKLSLRVRAFVPEVFKDEEIQRIFNHLSSPEDKGCIG